MSAIELIELVKQHLKHLPADEQAQFFQTLDTLEESQARSRVDERKPLSWPDIHERHLRIFGNRILPANIVLAARDEDTA
jgi:hypothetical protein